MSDVEIHLKAFDEASEVIRNVGENTAKALGNVENSGAAVTRETERVKVSVKDTALSFNNMAAAGMALYMSVDRVQEANLRLDRANLMVQRSNEGVERAQTAYNLALSRFGVNSTEAKDAADKLTLAEEAHRIAIERADQAQNNVNQTMMQAALSVVPSLITMVKSAHDAFKGFEGATSLLTRAFDVMTGPVGLAIIGITAAATVVYAMIQNFMNASAQAERFRREHEEIVATLEKTDMILETTVTSVQDLTVKYEGLTSACGELQEQLETQEKNLADLDSKTSGLKSNLFGLVIENSKFGDILEENTEAVEEHIVAIKEEIAAAERATEQTKRQLEVSDIYFKAVTKASDEYKRSVMSTGEVVADVFADQTRSLVEKTEIVNAVIGMFAARWGLSWDEASRTVGDSVSKIIGEMSRVQDSFAEVPTAISESLGPPAALRGSNSIVCVLHEEFEGVSHCR